ncbi:islet cell autoantigen 1 [Teleopsis dalmanni]|uniref:islet cell autoantigen 1 n=1 Tax=Teleopsis dalmanni TaxID=139649 RepID=UPI000D32A380|nr:islet cell autoantigen 1 [Teleopsis dalmanni]
MLFFEELESNPKVFIKMLKSEMQHQFWITKKAVQRKLGSKEDEHIISSDAELDAKIEILKSISDTSCELSKIIEQYQERLCVLSQEECVFGRFLKEVGKRSKTTGASITNTGKAVSYCGQQRMCVRVPLLRLQHEVDVFRVRAVRDTQITIQNMEKERTEYRAALSWMKSASSELDPDTGKGLEKFRTAQSHVRTAKRNFDSLSLDSVQKIDLLAAARCNMYSHALVSYMSELKQFAQKTASTFEAIAKTLGEKKTKYDFCVLKDLTQNEVEECNENRTDVATVDKDQTLFFADDYIDERKTNKCDDSNTTESPQTELIELSQQLESLLLPNDSLQTNLFDSSTFWPKAFSKQSSEHISLTSTSSTVTDTHSNENRQTSLKKDENQKVKSNHWFDLFADLDPLANPEAFDLKLNCGRTNFQQT